jgi:ABC-2 type transport system permease protein
MNPHHMSAFLWLRWRLFLNQLKRGGRASQIILGIIAVKVVVLAVVFFVGAFAAGMLTMPHAPASVQLLIWDGLICVFLFSWLAGLLNELQRSEALTLDKFLHLPVSLAGVFVLNYLSSWMSLALLFFMPPMSGLALGQVFGSGPIMLAVLPLVATFFFAVTALTYQFQGWLAALMVNKRRRRTIIVTATLLLLLVSQAPQLINFLVPWRAAVDDRQTQRAQKSAELDQLLRDQKITAEEYQKQMHDFRREATENDRQLWETVQQAAWLANVALPPGWLALGSASAADGNVLPALLGTAGFALVGGASLWRAYRTVLRLYLGEFTGAKKTPAPIVEHAPTLNGDRPTTTFLDKAIPWLSEQAAVVALAGFRSLTRAPEAKMLLLSPIFMLVVGVGLYFRLGSSEVPHDMRTLIAYAVMAMTLVMLMQIMGNQFGFDRAGFRIFVLSSAPRREILLGKNLAVAPLIVLMLAPILVLMQFFLPMRPDHLLALPGQFVSMFLLYALVANALSILAPLAIAAGTLKPANPKGLVLLIHLLFFILVSITLAPTLLPWAVETALTSLELDGGVPICLILTCLECAAIVALYRLVLGWQGRWLEGRELKILEAVTTKAE